MTQVEARRGSLGSCEKYRHQYSDGLSGGNRRDRSALKGSRGTIVELGHFSFSISDDGRPPSVAARVATIRLGESALY